MEDDYLNHLKEVQQEQLKIKEMTEELEKRKLRLKETRAILDKVDNYKQDFINTAIQEKEENYKLFQRGIKRCLVCGHQTREEDSLKHGKFSLFNSCPNCKSRCWLVGEMYPCEICERTTIRPLTHHIDGNRENNILENLTYICSDCHTAIHLGIGHRKGNKNGKRGKRRMVFGEKATSKIRDYSIKYREGIKSRGNQE